MQENIGELEQRYQALLGDYQTGRIDEATFIAEVDQLQFRDDWGRYWMLGAQSGAWHYYDGQTWRQANPAEADKLPFLDEAGRYWQKGVKSGEWYYYDSQTGEWTKPGQDDPVAPSMASTGQWPPAPSAAPQPTFDYQTPQYSQPAVDPAAQFEAGLFQDDEGRYWAMGARTGQWYFYDHEGWHPAHEFQEAGNFQPSYAAYPTPAPQDSRPVQVYGAQPYQSPKNPKTQPGGSQPQPRQASPVQSYSMGPQPVQAYQAPAEPPGYQQPGPAPAYPYPTPPAAQPQPAPPPGAPNQSGSWFYFDGKQWLKYATNEPAAEAPPDPRLILDQEVERPKAESKAAAPKAETKSESVVAEFFEEDEPPVEVVDVEVITVIEPEPDEDDAPPAPRSAPAKPAAADEDVRPRRSKTSPVIPVAPSTSSFNEPPRQPRSRTASTPEISSLVPRAKTSDSTRSVSPRRRPATQEPTVILPTGGLASGISSSSSRPSRPTRPLHPDPRRARDITAPMPPVKPATETAEAEAAPEPGRHRQVTQAMPSVAPSMANVATARTSTGQMKATPRAKTQEKLDPAAGAKPAPAQATKEGYTFGDVLRSFPSTAWTFIGGLVVLLIFAFIIIGAISLVSEGDAFGIGAVSVTNPTPTLDVAPPDSTPTPGPTPSSEANSAIATPTAVSMATYSNPELDFTMEYPEDWELEEEETRAIISPSERGLNADTPEDTHLWIGIPDEESSTISELLDSILDQFPNDLEILNEGTISIAGQTWTSTQIRFDDENLGGQGIATIAVTNKAGKGYVLVALAPAEEWNSVQPLFQGVINSFRFGAEEVIVAKATSTTSASQSARNTPASTAEAEEEEDAAIEEAESEAEATPTPEDTPTPEPTPTPETTATPLVYAIQPGDTLLEIAARFGVDLDLLTTENGIDNPSGLQVGQELVIPFTAEQLKAYNEGREVPAPAAPAEAAAGEEEAETAETEAEEAGATEPEEEQAAAAPAPASREAPAAPAAPVSGRIVYPAYSPSINSFDVWMVDLATGEQTPIAGNASQPAFNRDGSLLAYRSWERSTRGIFFRDFIGGRGGMVTRFVEDGLPAWAPDGYSFVFASRKEGDRVPRVYVGNQQGENPFSVGFNGEYPSVFPDGRIVAKGCLPSGDCGMFILGARGGGEKKISTESSDTAPAVSPDGSKIAFMSSGRGARNWEIWVMNADGSNATRLTENGNNDGLPTWSPDGKSIAYVSDQGGVWAVWAMNADGSNQRKLFDMKGSPDGKVSHDEFNSRGWLEERISWAP